MSFPRYSKYKDSGVEWLGEVPEGWKVISIKWLSPVKRGASPRPIDDAKYFDDEGEFAWVRIADVSASDGILKETTQRLSELGSSLSVKINPGELFVSIAGTVGKPCLSNIKACIHDGFVYFPTLKIDPRFLYRIFEEGTCYGGLGKWGTQLNLNTDTIGSIRIALPPSNEFNQILSFLDQETAKIDDLIAEQQRLIELLKEKRQAVISHAITKGLNPDAPMKPSGIEWLGDVPAHWETWKLAHAYSVIGSGTTPRSDNSDYYEGGSIPWINTGDLNDGDLEECGKRITDRALADHSSLKIYPAGSLLIAMYGATIGKLGILRFPATVNQACCVFAGSSPINSNFMFYWFLGLRQQILSLATGGGQPNVSQDILRALRVACPDKEEQMSIAEFLDCETTKLDTLTTEAQRAITLLQERRTALISAAVTGKIDVRGFIEQRKAA
jgi:type I restriction enzyme S subunit